jgi:hypothetical protein
MSRFLKGTLLTKLQLIDQQSLDAASGRCGLVENHRLWCIAAESAASRSLGWSNPAGKQTPPRTTGGRSVMPTGFEAANVSSKTAGRSSGRAGRDNLHSPRLPAPCPDDTLITGTSETDIPINMMRTEIPPARAAQRWKRSGKRGRTG